MCDATAQGTKACLGWERAPEGGLHACTAVVDAWLRLLQRALHAVRALRAAVPAAPPAIGLNADGCFLSCFHSLSHPLPPSPPGGGGTSAAPTHGGCILRKAV